MYGNVISRIMLPYVINNYVHILYIYIVYYIVYSILYIYYIYVYYIVYYIVIIYYIYIHIYNLTYSREPLYLLYCLNPIVLNKIQYNFALPLDERLIALIGYHKVLHIILLEFIFLHIQREYFEHEDQMHKLELGVGR